MALRLFQPGHYCLGQFDGYDSEVGSFLGGEVCSLVDVGLGGDKAAKDMDGSDGYTGVTNKTRPVVTKVLVSGLRPLFLADDGTSGYGTLFGSVVGGTVGQVVTGGTVLGPHSALGSGKITLWEKQGLYGVTLDAVDTTAATGLVPTNPNLNVGDPIYARTTGKLTALVSASFESSLSLGRFVEFKTDGSLVTTPTHLVSAVNSPSGSNPQTVQFTQALFFWSPPVG